MAQWFDFWKDILVARLEKEFNEFVTWNIFVRRTENQVDQNSEAQHGEFEEIHCSSSLGSKYLDSYLFLFSRYLRYPLFRYVW